MGHFPKYSLPIKKRNVGFITELFMPKLRITEWNLSSPSARGQWKYVVNDT